MKLGLYVAPFGPLATPLARRRPWDVARHAATLDRLSGGRADLTSAERPDAGCRAELESGGATWWLQGFGDRPALDEVDAAAAAGPPQ